MVDAARLRKMVEKVTTLPGADWDDGIPEWPDAAWNQSDWVQVYAADGTQPKFAVVTERGVLSDGKPCKTACCLAGQTVVDFAPEGTILRGEYVLLPGGTVRNVDELAGDLLGGIGLLDRRELFFGGNDAADLRRISEDIIAKHGE